MKKLQFVACCSALTSPFVFANAAMEKAIPNTMIGLSLVIGAIVFLAWSLKKMKVTHMLGGHAKMKIVSQLAVGQKERIVVLDVNGEQVLIGITPTQINYLKKLENPIVVTEAENAPSSSFASVMEKVKKK